MSIKRYIDAPAAPVPARGTSLLDPQAGSEGDALVEACRMLLDSTISVTRGSEADSGKLEGDLHSLAERLNAHSGPFEILEIASMARDVLEDHAERAASLRRRRTEELQAMIAMLTDTVSTVSEGNRRTISRLQTIEKEIESATASDDMHKLKLGLADCLRTLRSESAVQKSESAATIRKLEEEISSARDCFSPSSQASRLDSKDEPALWECGVLPEPVQSSTDYLAVFVLDRAEIIASRYGAAMLRRILGSIADRVRQHLSGSDRLLRWKGASFVAILHRTGTPEETMEEVRALSSFPPDHYYEMGLRTALFDTPVRWTVLRMADYASLGQLFQEADRFVNRLLQVR